MEATATAPIAGPSPRDHGIPFGEALRVWAKVAALSFGGPAGQIAMMHRVLVEERRWIGEERFLHALNYCMLLPGPEAQQLATYLGWLMHGTRGAIVAGGLFILPGFAAILGLSLLYVHFGHTPAVGGLLLGLRAAVLAIVLQAVVRIGRRTIRTPLAAGLAAGAFVSLLLFSLPFPLVVLVAGIVGLMAGRIGVGGLRASTDTAPETAPFPHLLRPAFATLALWLMPVAGLFVLAGPGNVFTTLAVFFSKMAMVTFGGAYAVLAYVAQAAVETFGWMTPPEMIDGLGLAETTPGPLIMVVQFVGFLAAFRNPGALDPTLAAILGSALVVWVTFLPSFLWIFLFAPSIERLRGNRALADALAAVTAAVVGVILNLAVWFGLHVLFREHQAVVVLGQSLPLPVPTSADPAAFALFVGALFALFALRAGVIPVIAMAGAMGMAWVSVAPV